MAGSGWAAPHRNFPSVAMVSLVSLPVNAGYKDRHQGSRQSARRERILHGWWDQEEQMGGGEWDPLMRLLRIVVFGLAIKSGEKSRCPRCPARVSCPEDVVCVVYPATQFASFRWLPPYRAVL